MCPLQSRAMAFASPFASFAMSLGSRKVRKGDGQAIMPQHYIAVLCFTARIGFNTISLCCVLNVQSKTLQYIGVSRGVQQSLRLHLARRPKDTYYFKVMDLSVLFGICQSTSLCDIRNHTFIAVHHGRKDYLPFATVVCRPTPLSEHHVPCEASSTGNPRWCFVLL